MSIRAAAHHVNMPERTLSRWKTTKPLLYRAVMEHYQRSLENGK